METEQPPKVTIVTVTYNAADFIAQYFSAINKVLEVGPHFSLVLVDNASTDDTVSVVERCLHGSPFAERCKFVKSSDNIGFGRGCNLGAENAKSFAPEILWFLNPDTHVAPNSAESLIQLIKKHDCDFAGSTLTDENNQLRSGAFRFPTPLTVFLSCSLLGVLARVFPDKTSTIKLADHAVEADWLTGASFMVKQASFARLEGFDAKYFLYFEEVDLFFRAKTLGMRVVSCPRSIVYHQSGASTGMNARKTTSKQARRPAFWFESRRYFYIKNFGKFTFFICDVAFISGMLIRKCKNIILRKPDLEPEYLLRDILRYSVLTEGPKT